MQSDANHCSGWCEFLDTWTILTSQSANASLPRSRIQQHLCCIRLKNVPVRTSALQATSPCTMAVQTHSAQSGCVGWSSKTSYGRFK
eukprot:2139394-Amphidinium_carterae.1